MKIRLRRVLALAIALASIATCIVTADATAAKAPSYMSGGVFRLPAGYQAAFSNATVDSCRAFNIGYDKNYSGGLTYLLFKATGCESGPITIAPIVNDTGQEFTFRLALEDDPCFWVYWSDGQSHSLNFGGGVTPSHVKLSGRNPYSVSINDGGAGCDTRSVPRMGRGSFNVMVTISPT